MKLRLPLPLRTALGAVITPAVPLATTVGAVALVFSFVSVPKAFADNTLVDGNQTVTDGELWNTASNPEEEIPDGTTVGGSGNAQVNEGAEYNFAELAGGTDVQELTLGVTPTPDVTADAANINVSDDSRVSESLTVDGGVVSFSVAEGKALTLGALSLTSGSRANFTGGGKVVLTSNMIFGSTNGAAGTPAQASDFTGLGTLELAQGVTLSMGTDDTASTSKRVESVKLANKVIMKTGSKLSINAVNAVIGSNFEMYSATIDYTDLLRDGTAQLNGNMVISGTNTINARWASAQNYQLNGTISGEGSLVLTRTQGDPNKNNLHFLISGTNTYTGGTTIGAGTHVKITNDSAFGTGPVVINTGGAIKLQEGVTFSSEDGAWRATGTSSSNTAVSATADNTAVSGAESGITFTNVDVTYAGTADATLNAALSGGSLTMDASGATLSVAKAYTDSGTAMTITAGTVKLEDSATWAGDITVGTGGTLNLSNNAATTHSNNITVNGEFIINAQETLTGVVGGTGTTTVNENLALNNAASSINLVSVATGKKITGSGTIAIVGNSSGELTISNQLQEHTGTVEIGNGKHLTMANSGYNNKYGLTRGNITITAGGKLTLQGGDSLGYRGAGADPTKIITMTGSAEGNASLEVKGNSRQTLSTQINLNGYTEISGNGSLESFDLNTQATYHFNVSGTNNTVGLKLQLRNGGFKINVADGGELTFSGKLAHRSEGANSVLTKSGTGTLVMSNTLDSNESLQTTMGVDVTGGVLKYCGDGADKGTTGVASVTVRNDAMIEYAHTDTSVHTFLGTINLNGANAVMKVSGGNQAQSASAAAISGTGKVQVTGGSLELTEANTYSGGTDVSGGALKISHAEALGTGVLNLTDGTLSLADGLTTTLNAASLGGTLELGEGSTYKLDRSETSLNALSLAGNSAIGMSADETLLTRLSISSGISLDSHTLTLDFSAPIASFTEDTSVENLVTGLTGLDVSKLNIKFAGNTVDYDSEGNHWETSLGRASYTWALSGDGVLSLNVVAGRAMSLVWNGGDGEWNQSSSNWNKESDGNSTVFENGDSVRIALSSDIMLDGDISTNDLRVDDGAAVSFSAKTGIDSDSLHAVHIKLGSEYAEGSEVTAGTQSLVLSGLHTTATDLTVEAGKTATLTLSGSASLTVNNTITVDTGASFTLDGGGQTVYTDGITVKQSSSATITGDVSGADNGLSGISTGAGSESANGGKLTIAGNVTGSELTLAAGSKGSIEVNGNVTGVSSITAESGAHVLINGDVSGNFSTITAGTKEGEYITFAGNVTIEGSGFTINGNATIGDGVSNGSGSTFFCGTGEANNGSLTIGSGTTVWKAYRRGTGGDITINAGATLDASEGVLWHDSSYVGGGTMRVNGTLIVRNLAYESNNHDYNSTMGRFHYNAGNFLLGNGAKIVVNEGSDDDQQGMKFNGQAAENTYTIVFNEGAESTINFKGGIDADTSDNKKHHLYFEVKQDAIVDLQYKVTLNDGDHIDKLSQITKTGDGNMTISLADGASAALGSFSGGLSVAGGKLTISAALSGLHSVSVAAGSTLELTNTLSITRDENDTTRRISIGGTADNTATIAFESGGSLSYDGVTYAAKTGLAPDTAAAISSKGTAELSLWNSEQTYSNLNILMEGAGTENNPREIRAKLEHSDLTLNNAVAGFIAENTLEGLTLEENATAIVKGATVNIESATIREGSKLKAMTQNAAWVDPANYTMTATQDSASLAHVALDDAHITGATDGGDDALKVLGELSGLTLAFAAENTAAEIRNVTMRDVTIRDGAISMNGVVAVASSVSGQEEAAPARMMARSLDAQTRADGTQTLTATTVKSGGSVSGDLTVDLDSSVLSPDNAGKTLVWTIFEGVSLADGESFTLKLGDILKTIVENGLPEVTLSGDWVANEDHSVVLTSANLGNLSTAEGGLLAAPVAGGHLVLTIEDIPEPTGSTLSLLALAALAARRRRRK